MMCADYIIQGPLLPLCGIDAEDVQQQSQDWVRLGDFMLSVLQFPSQEALDDVQRSAIHLHGHIT